MYRQSDGHNIYTDDGKTRRITYRWTDGQGQAAKNISFSELLAVLSKNASDYQCKT